MPGAADPAAGPAPEPWRLVWSDEFDAGAIDPEKWDFDVNCWGGGNNERQCYTDRPENVRVEDGALLIIARRERVSGPALPVPMREPGVPVEMRSMEYSSARIVTRGRASWRYGRIEVRARLPRGQGVWPAIWMLPEDRRYGGWAASGEIDIMEAVNLGTPCPECESGVEDQVLGTLHYGAEWPDNAYSGRHTTLPDQARGTHTFALDWSSEAIVWRVDGEIFACQTPGDWFTTAPAAQGRPAAPFDQPFHLVMNVAIGGGLPERENLGGVSEEGFPKTMQVDFVRVYEWAGEAEMPVPAEGCGPEYRGDSSTTGG
ncbi:glycoside hydrolase family 16 protein [Marinicauda algicola]|uniref:glycoside hydrolase family 16 protein n=1 Tax=Marinicauda algicola TaxID=2029849 RepID=UPI0019D29276|nr:glycoside hydrolase family 16 protein [Marinicauda algicola]